jgi:hypothetical protein
VSISATDVSLRRNAARPETSDSSIVAVIFAAPIAIERFDDFVGARSEGVLVTSPESRRSTPRTRGDDAGQL